MTSVDANEIQWIYTQLIPYFASVGVYFTLFIPYESPSYWAAMVKCAPIVSLMYFVKKVGSRNGQDKFSSRILAGLIFCCIGDALLLWNRTFIPGMLAFMIGHMNYIWAFGFSPLRLNLGILIFTFGGIAVAFLYPGITGVLVIGVPFYIFIISAMVWRATARIGQPLRWIQLSPCIGSFLFAMSDLMIGIDRFVGPIAHSQLLIMSSYYAAQLGISLSVSEWR